MIRGITRHANGGAAQLHERPRLIIDDMVMRNDRYAQHPGGQQLGRSPKIGAVDVNDSYSFPAKEAPCAKKGLQIGRYVARFGERTPHHVTQIMAFKFTLERPAARQDQQWRQTTTNQRQKSEKQHPTDAAPIPRSQCKKADDWFSVHQLTLLAEWWVGDRLEFIDSPRGGICRIQTWRFCHRAAATSEKKRNKTHLHMGSSTTSNSCR